MDKEAHTHRRTPPPKHLTNLTLSVYLTSHFLAFLRCYTHIHTLLSFSLFCYVFFSLCFFSPAFSVCVLVKLFKSCVRLTLSLIHSPSLPSLSSVFSPCRCSVIGVIFIPCLSATVAAGWLNIYIFHSLVTFPCCRSGSSSLLAALLLTDYCLQISYGHSKWYTGSHVQRVQRLDKGGKREREWERDCCNHGWL